MIDALASAQKVVGPPDAASQISGFIFAVLLLDPEGRVREANPAAENLLGRSAHRLIGLRLTEIASFGDPRIGADLGPPLVARDVAIAIGAESRRVDLLCAPVDGHPGWSTVALSEAAHSREEQGAGAVLHAPAILAHEIKNPLAAIRGAGQLLARRLEARDRPLATIIAAEVERIAGLIDRMQQLGGSSKPGEGACNPHEAIRSALAGARAARGDGIDFIEQFDPSLPPVDADAGALQQVLSNLISNACDACADVACPCVQVQTRFAGGPVYNILSDGKSRRLPIEIVVTDNGPGIAPEICDHVFEPFVTGKPHGQGLGLALARKLVRDMGGRIAHQRDEAAGLTSFRICLAVASAGSGA